MLPGGAPDGRSELTLPARGSRPARQGPPEAGGLRAPRPIAHGAARARDLVATAEAGSG